MASRNNNGLVLEVEEISYNSLSKIVGCRSVVRYVWTKKKFSLRLGWPTGKKVPRTVLSVEPAVVEHQENVDFVAASVIKQESLANFIGLDE